MAAAGVQQNIVVTSSSPLLPLIGIRNFPQHAQDVRSFFHFFDRALDANGSPSCGQFVYGIVLAYLVL